MESANINTAGALAILIGLGITTWIKLARGSPSGWSMWPERPSDRLQILDIADLSQRYLGPALQMPGEGGRNCKRNSKKQVPLVH